MTTDFNYNNKTINSGGPIKPSGTDQPGDPRTRVDFYSDIESIPNPYIGMIVTVKMDETNQNKMTDYKVLSLKANALGIANSVIDRVQKYSEYLGVNTGGSVDLSGYATKDELNSKANTSDIPTNTSELNNDSGFLTSIPSEYVTETEMNEAIANISSGGSVSQEDISTAVNNYLTEHPVTGGATAEQANQIEANKTNISTLKELVEKPITFDKLDRGLSNLFEPKFNPISFSWDVDKGGYNKDGFNSDSTWSKVAIPVIEGEKYKITGYVLGKSRLFVLGDENKSYTRSSVMYPDYEQTVSQWTLYKDIEVTIPSGYKYLLISTADKYIGHSIIKKENEYLNKRAEEVNTELLKNIQELKDNTTVYSYSVYTPAWVDGKYFNSDQKIVNTMDGWSCVELSVNIGDSFKISGHTNQWVPLYCLVDKDNEIIQINERTSQLTELFNEVVTVKNDNCKLYVNSRLNCTTIMKNDGLISKSQDEVLTLQAENKALKKKIIEEQIKNDFTWKEFDKIYVTFTFDDTLEDISDIVSLFKSKGVPVCLATVYMRLGITTNSGKTALEVCKECEENGGEILSHHTLPLTSTRTDDDYNEVIVNSYFELTKKGLNIDGIITTGGTDDNGNDWHTGDFNKCVELMRPYYKYSDLYGCDTGVTQYFHQRKFLTTDDAVNKGFIDSAISQGNQWLSLASHGVNDNVTVELLTSLLDYIATKDNVEIVTFRYLHNKFGTTKLEKSVTDNGTKDTEIVDARGGDTCLNNRLVGIENGEYINEVSFEKIKKARPQGEIYTIDNFNTWSKWSGVSDDVNKVTSLSNGGIEIAISNALTSNLVLSKNNVDLKSKKLILKFDITVKSIISDGDRFTLSLNNSITLKTVYLNKFKIGKTTTVSIDFNDTKLVTGKLALVLNKPCNCTLENLKLEECITVEGYQTLEEVITDVEELKLKSECIKEFVLPSVIPVVKEFETNIFWDNTLLNTNINSVERIDVGNSIGGRNNVMKDRWRINLSSSQTDITQTFNVYFDNTTNVSQSLSIPIVALDKSLGSGQTKDIIFIGDSLTDNNKYQPELLNLFNNDVMNINLLGSRGSSPNLHEGRSGWTSKHYCTTSNFNGKDNAFWNPSISKFDFSYYMTSQDYSKVDYVFIHLGTNCLANQNTETLSYFKEMVNSIKAFNSDIVVFIGLCPPLSSRSDNFSLKNKRIKLIKLLLNEFDNRQGERILISPLILNFDAYNGFPSQGMSGTRHDNENLKVVTDNTHPLQSEYFKMADTIYCSIKYAVSLGY